MMELVRNFFLLMKRLLDKMQFQALIDLLFFLVRVYTLQRNYSSKYIVISKGRRKSQFRKCYSTQISRCHGEEEVS